ncbi:MAG: hypothetical protein V7731_02230 [Amphritea sp.]
MEENERLREMVFEVIENQIRDNNPKETKITLDRLVSRGIPHDEAMKYIGCVVSTEIFDIIRDGKEFDEKAYIKALQALPTLPWE